MICRILVLLVLLFPVTAQAEWHDPFVNTYDWLHEAPPPKARNWYQKLLIPNVPYDNAEKILMTTYLGLQVADVTTTIIALNGGAEEANPLFGKNPNTETLVLAKLASGMLVYIGLNHIDNHTFRKTLLTVANVFYCGVIMNNVGVIKGLY